MWTFVKGGRLKGTCPKCGHRKVFAFLQDENGTQLSDIYGRCDRQNSCGYELYPDKEVKKEMNRPQENETPLVYPRAADVLAYVKNLSSPFHDYCVMLGISHEHLQKWGVGTDERGNTTFIYASAPKTPVNIKYIPYAANGRRIKEKRAWMLVNPKEKGADGKEREIGRFLHCLYGQNRLSPLEENRPVCLVESEKTAVICAHFYPAFDWVATGGANGFSKDLQIKVGVLHNRKLILLPDADNEGRKGYQELKKTFEDHGITVQVLDVFADRSDGYDLADAAEDYRRGKFADLPKIAWEFQMPTELLTRKLKAETPFNYERYSYEKYKDLEVPTVYKFEYGKPPPNAERIASFVGEDGEVSVLGRIGDIIAITAQAGYGKSSLLEAFYASALNPSDPTIDTFGLRLHLPPGKKILHIDTEMTPSDVYENMCRTFRRAKVSGADQDLIDVYGLVGVEKIEEKLLTVLNRMETGEYGFIVLDLVTHLLLEPNSEVESTTLVSKLKAIAVRKGFLLCVLIHTNEGSESKKARGHIGSYLTRDAAWVGNIQGKEGGVRVVNTEKGRKMGKFSFAMVWSKEERMFVSCDVPEEKGISRKKKTEPQGSFYTTARERMEDEEENRQQEPPWEKEEVEYTQMTMEEALNAEIEKETVSPPSGVVDDLPFNDKPPPYQSVPFKEEQYIPYNPDHFDKDGERHPDWVLEPPLNLRKPIFTCNFVVL